MTKATDISKALVTMCFKKQALHQSNEELKNYVFL